MRALLISAALISLAACAPAPSNTPRAEVRTGTVGLVETSSASNFNTPVAYPLEKVWLALPGIYASLGIPIQMIDPKTHQLGNEGFKTRKVLGKTPLSHFIECGTTQIGPNADSYDVVLTVLTTLQPGESGGTNVLTSVQSSAKPVTYSQEYSRCSSKGFLEPLIADSLKARLSSR